MAEEVKQQMEGKWIVYKSEDFGKYLDKLGINQMLQLSSYTRVWDQAVTLVVN